MPCIHSASIMPTIPEFGLQYVSRTHVKGAHEAATLARRHGRGLGHAGFRGSRTQEAERTSRARLGKRPRVRLMSESGTTLPCEHAASPLLRFRCWLPRRAHRRRHCFPRSIFSLTVAVQPGEPIGGHASFEHGRLHLLPSRSLVHGSARGGGTPIKASRGHNPYLWHLMPSARVDSHCSSFLCFSMCTYKRQPSRALRTALKALSTPVATPGFLRANLRANLRASEPSKRVQTK